MGLCVRAAVCCVLCWHALSGCAPPPPSSALLRDRPLTEWAERWSGGRSQLGSDSLWLGGSRQSEARLRFALPPRQALGRAQLILHTTESWPGSARASVATVRVEGARPALLRSGRRDGPPIGAVLPQARDRPLSFALEEQLAHAWAERAPHVWLRIALDADGGSSPARVPLASPAHPDRNKRPRLLLY